MIYDNLLRSHYLFLEGPESDVLIDVLLVSAAEGQEEVVEELVTDDLLFVTDLALDDLSLLNLLLTINLTILFPVVGLQCLQLIFVQDV